MKRDICIRGAGIVGKTAALVLAQQGLKVALMGAKYRHSGTDIRAYAINTRSRRMLEQLKAWPDTACAVEHMRVYGDGDGQLHFQQEQPCLAHIADAAAIEQQLDEALRYQSRITLCEDAPCSDSGADSGADTGVLSGDTAPLTLICEGKSSSTRAALGVVFSSHDYGQTALAARLRCSGGQPHTAYQWFDKDEVLALLPRGEQAVDSADADDAADAAHYALVWSLPPERARELQALPADAFAAELAQAIAQGGGLHGDGEIPNVWLDSELASWPLRLAQADRWTGQLPDGRAWVLAGDAAHAMHPLAGQGLNCGLADIACLAEVLENRDYFRELSDMRVLRSYERRQKAHWQSLRDVTDGLQQVFSGDRAGMHVARNWGMNRLNSLSPLKNLLVRRAMDT